jgi:hypothetical protein
LSALQASDILGYHQTWTIKIRSQSSSSASKLTEITEGGREEEGNKLTASFPLHPLQNFHVMLVPKERSIGHEPFKKYNSLVVCKLVDIFGIG